MQQNIVLSIQDRLQQLPKSERKIAEYILKNTETVISMNAQELAKQQLTLNKSYRRALFMWLSEAVRH